MKLVTGAGGFIGRAIVTAYGSDALALSRSSVAGANHVTFDISHSNDTTKLLDLLQGYEITEIIHAAGVTPWSTSADFSADLKMAQTLTVACNLLHIPRLTFLSGWIVYDMQHGSAPFGEDTRLGPTTPYGQSKLAIERYFQKNLSETVLINARLASVYGPGQTSPGLIPNFVSTALDGGELSVASMKTRRDYLYIDDLSTALKRLSSKEFSESIAINLGSGTSVTVMEVAETIARCASSLYQKDVTIIRSPHTQETPPLDNCLDITRACKSGAFGSRTTSLFDGIRAFMEWSNNEKALL